MLASPLSVLVQSYRLYSANLWVFVGYSAWLLFPIAGIYLLSFLPERTYISYASVFLFTLVQLIISIWLTILFIQLTDLLDQNSTESETTKQKIDLEALQKKSVLLLRPMIRVMARQFLFVIVGFIALIVPGIIMLVWYAFSQTASVIDEKKDMEALAFSKSLGKGRLLSVGYRLIAGPFLVGFIFSIVIIILFSLISIFT